MEEPNCLPHDQETKREKDEARSLPASAVVSVTTGSPTITQFIQVPPPDSTSLRTKPH